MSTDAPAHARAFAEAWIAAWNAHDLDRVLAHYADDVEMRSPVIVAVVGEPSGVLRGKAVVADYWRRALALHADLHFELIDVLRSAGSLTILYRNLRGRLAAECLFFNAAGLVERAAAHYADDDASSA